MLVDAREYQIRLVCFLRSDASTKESEKGKKIPTNLEAKIHALFVREDALEEAEKTEKKKI